jgi:hypothetical protein
VHFSQLLRSIPLSKGKKETKNISLKLQLAILMLQISGYAALCKILFLAQASSFLFSCSVDA